MMFMADLVNFVNTKMQQTSEVLLLPVLRFLSDGEIHTPPELRSAVSKLVQNGDDKGANGCTRADNWVAFALKNLQRAEVINKVEKRKYRINARGRELLTQGHSSLTISILKRYPEMLQSLHDAADKAVRKRTGESF